MDDPRQHREGGDGDGRAQEQRRLQQLGLGREQSGHVQQPWRQHEGEHERHGDAGQRHAHRAAVARVEVLAAEIGADQEHVQAHAELRGHVQHVQGRLGEQRLLQVRQQRAEQRRPQRHAGDHLADHLRLAQAPGQQADQPAYQQDHRRLQEEIHRHLRGGHGRPSWKCRRMIGGRGDEIHAAAPHMVGRGAFAVWCLARAWRRPYTHAGRHRRTHRGAKR
ncbi:hypothetical protein NB689_002782 [Xanthomonas sacchari]|nr:hypothetical protein [Xanthomonas sacchari]